MRELNHRNYMFMNQTVRYFTLNSTLRDVSSHPKQLQELKMKQPVGYFLFLTTMCPIENVKNIWHFLEILKIKNTIFPNDIITNKNRHQ